jgi:SlyX protein
MSEQHIADLESRISFQEDHIQTLNKVVADLQLEMIDLQEQLRHTQERIKALLSSDCSSAQSEPPPPHY